MMTPLISLKQVNFTYPLKVEQETKKVPSPTLVDITLDIARGTYVVVLGHNGSGKSTLARHLNALLIPNTGDVLVAGKNTRDREQQRSIRDTVGMIFANPDNQIIATHVDDDVAWSLMVRGLPLEVIKERVATALAETGLSGMAKLAPQYLSGGQRQRLAIAGMLALQPACLIADEATAMLDPLSRAEINKLLHKLNQEQNITIIQITHLLEEALLADRVIVMEKGLIVMDMSPAQLFADVSRLLALNLKIPSLLELIARLRETGWAIPQDVLSVEKLATVLKK